MNSINTLKVSTLVFINIVLFIIAKILYRDFDMSSSVIGIVIVMISIFIAFILKIK